MILDSLDNLSWPAVGTATAVAVAIGMAWFSPRLLGGFWARHVAHYSGIPEVDITANASQPPVLGRWIVAIAVSIITLALAVDNSTVDSAGDGAVVGLTLAVGIAAAFFSWPPIFARMPWQWWFVNSAAFVVMLSAAGAVIGARQ